jgi:hypothetical protein
MSQDDREKPAAKTTIVGGRQLASGKIVDAVPRGIEILLKKAAVDESFRKTLLSERSNAADAIGLTLKPAETAMLKAMPESALDRMIAATKVQPKIRQAFMGYTAAIMLAALTAASDGLPQDLAQTSRGIQPDEIQGPGMPTGGVRPDIVMPSSPAEEKQAEQYKSQSYLKISERDKNAPKGNLEVTIENWQNGGVNSGVFMKVHFAKTEADHSRETLPPTEGLGYARRGNFLQENVPVGTYRVEIGFVDQPYLRSKEITIKEKETAKVSFRITSAGTTPGKVMTKGITVDIE